MDAILDSEELAYKFPETEQELNEAAQGFAALSSHGAIKGCMACLDGYLLQIKVPAGGNRQCQGILLWPLSDLWDKCASCM